MTAASGLQGSAPGLFSRGIADVPGMQKPSGLRAVVLATIVGLHVGVLIYATLLKPAAIKPPEIPPVMMQLLAEPAAVQAISQTISPPAPPTPPARPTPPVPTPPVPKQAKPIVRKLPPAVPTKPKQEIRENAEPPVEVVNERAPAQAAPPAASAPSEPSASTASAAPPSPPAAAPAAATPATAISQPRFNAAYLNNPAPAYPPMARRLGEEGKVMLRVYVTPEGTAGEVRIHTSSGSGMFDEAAMAAVRQWRFVPARQGENAVAAWVQVPIVFKLG